MKRLSLLLITVILCTTSTSAQFFKEIQRFDKPRSEEGQCFASGGAMDMNDSILVVGAACAKDASGLARGRVEIFERDSSNQWARVQLLSAPILRDSPAFGRSIALNENTLAVSATNEGYDENENNYLLHAGAVYIFKRNSSGTWVFVQKLVAPLRHADDHFGESIDLWRDTLIVGSEYYSRTIGGTTYNYAGGAFVYYADSNGVWQHSKSLFHPTAAPTAWTGYACKVAINNGVLAVASDRDDIDTGGTSSLTRAGSIFVYQLDSTNDYSLSQKLVSPVLMAGQRFGNALSLSGSVLVTGSVDDGYDFQGQNQRSHAGSAVIFNRLPNNSFDSGQKVTPSDRDFWDCFGWCVASNDEFVVVTAARDEGMPIVNDAGSAYIFTKDSNNVWIEAQKLLTLDRDRDQFTGRSIAMTDTEIVIGTDYEGYERDQQNNLVSGAHGAFNVFRDCPTEYLPFVHVEPAYMISELIHYDFQWLRCTPNGYIVLPGENHQSFYPPDTGYFAVAVTHNDCSDTIGCFRDNNIGIEEQGLNGIKIFPNPNTGAFTLQVPTSMIGAEVHLVDAKGVVCYSGEIHTSRMEYRINLPSGIYLLTILKDGVIAGYGRVSIQE